MYIVSSLRSIGENAFAFCLKLSNLVMHDGIVSIGRNAFYACVSLTKVELPRSITSLGDGAFDSCFNIVIEYGDTKIAENLKNRLYSDDGENKYFAPIICNCSKNDIADNGYIYVVADNGIMYALKDGFAKVVGHSYIFGEIYIASNVIYKSELYEVTEIDDMALLCSYYVTNINLSNNITRIGNLAFADCSSLISIEMSKSITHIGSYAFSNCIGLTKIELPISIINMGSEVFDRCLKLKIYCETKSQPNGWNSDWNASNLPVEWGYVK